MRVEVEREPATRMVKVWVLQDGRAGRGTAWTPLGDGPEWTEVHPGSEVPTSLRLPEEVWAAIVAAGSDVPVPSRAQHDHLTDAVAVRDRLLTMVEGFALTVSEGR